MSSAIDFSYNYNAASALSVVEGTHRLALATSGGTSTNPLFFDGKLTKPKLTGDLLLALSAISRTRFFSPVAIRQLRIVAADPVVTCDGGQLRFEVFSVCCGAYARFDLAGNAFDGSWLSKGTTNVDFNPPMRTVLSTLQNNQTVGLKVGLDSVELVKGEHSVIERKVKLPVRWLRSFVEVQSYQARVNPTAEMDPAEFDKLLLTLPNQNIMQSGVVSYITPIARGYRLSQCSSANAIAVGAISRLKALEPILRFAKSVKVYTSDNFISAFELEFEVGRFVLVLSPNASRGFSGEGQSLSDLAGKVDDSVINKVRANLTWQSNISPDALAQSLTLTSAQVQNALQILGTRGLVGFDISSNSFFHRELPFDISMIEELHPRLLKARSIMQSDGVSIAPSAGGSNRITAHVIGDKNTHLVQIQDENYRCTCEWYLKHGCDRGPCSHVLAVELRLQDSTI